METIKEILKNREIIPAASMAMPLNDDYEEKPVDLCKILNISSASNTFKNFKKMAGTTESYQSAMNMLKEENPPMLLILGGCGNGKTYLLEAISLALYKKGIRCSVMLWTDIRRKLLQAMNRPRQGQVDYETYFEQIRGNPHRIIDDIGMGSKMTDWEVSELEDIINHRYRKKLFTVVSTNRTLEELPERIVSRFLDPIVSRVVVNHGKDYRIIQCEKQNAQ